jgi:DNA-binding ferritin-like protein
MAWCRIDNDNFVIEVIDFDPTDRFNESLVWYACPDGTQQGWIKDGTNFRPATASDSLTLEEYKNEAESIADGEAERRIALAEANPLVGQDLDENGRIRNNRRRNNKAKRKINEITDADDHLLDHIDLIYDSLYLRLDAIEAAADYAAVEAIINDISNDIHWPTWSPI